MKMDQPGSNYCTRWLKFLLIASAEWQHLIKLQPALAAVQFNDSDDQYQQYHDFRS
jgi:hypothetical protein